MAIGAPLHKLDVPTRKSIASFERYRPNIFWRFGIEAVAHCIHLNIPALRTANPILKSSERRPEIEGIVSHCLAPIVDDNRPLPHLP